MNTLGNQNMDNIASNVTYGASGAAFFLGLNVEQWGILSAMVAIVIGICGLAFNMWFKMKYKRD